MASQPQLTPLDSARRKAFRRLLPVLFLAYFIAYVDRNNVAIAALTMPNDLPWLNKDVLGTAMGMFFIGYVLLEIPGTLIVERWSARKWISRIMVSWGLMAALTAAVATPSQFYWVRFLLGLAEAGFFPGVIVYLTHWFPVRDRAKALSYFLVATPVAQMVNPKISGYLLMIGSHEIDGKIVMPAAGATDAAGTVTQWVKLGTQQVVEGTATYHPEILGLAGWQWVYILWAIPAVILGVAILWLLTDRPGQAKWLTGEEREALEGELAREKAAHSHGKKMTVMEALRHPKVLLLTVAYFCTVTASYGIEYFMPSIMNDWYSLSMNDLTWLIILPPTVALLAQLGAGWSSDHFKERRYHAVVPLLIGSAALGMLPFSNGNLGFTVICFMIAFGGFKGYMPAFWSLPNVFLVEAAAAGSIGLINSFGNLGGYLGPKVMGWVYNKTGSYDGSLWFLCCSMMVTAAIIFMLGLGKKQPGVRAGS
jgi:ACS family tartrate transporter-like MFS transporter